MYTHIHILLEIRNETFLQPKGLIQPPLNSEIGSNYVTDTLHNQNKHIFNPNQAHIEHVIVLLKLYFTHSIMYLLITYDVSGIMWVLES